MRVVVKTDTVCTHSEQEPEQYGSWSASYNFSITDVRVEDESYETEYEEEGFLIPDGSEYAYVISMIYSSGDSFGSSDGNGDVIAVFGDLAKAEKALAKISEQKESFEIEVEDDFGRQIKLWNPGAGYFEHISALYLETYPLNPNVVKRKIEF